MKKIPKGVVAATITGNQNHMSNLSRNVMQMLELGNDHDGFNISGWIKRGTIADSGVVQPPTPCKWDKPQQVVSGGLTYHLTKTACATPPSNIKLQELQFNGGSLV
jgi:hypothetical protein